MEAVVLDRISTLLQYRRWFRLHPNLLTGHRGQQIRHEYTVELRALVKLARAARKAERREFVDHPADAKVWTESELRMAWGNR